MLAAAMAVELPGAMQVASPVATRVAAQRTDSPEGDSTVEAVVASTVEAADTAKFGWFRLLQKARSAPQPGFLFVAPKCSLSGAQSVSPSITALCGTHPIKVLVTVPPL
jgi:hypothetical protein